MRVSRRRPLPDALPVGVLLLVSLFCGFPMAVAADEQSDRSQDDRSDVVSASADHIQLFLNADTQHALEMKPVFQWADPVLPKGKQVRLFTQFEPK